MTAPAKSLELGPAVSVEVPEAFDVAFDPPLGSVRFRAWYGGRGGAKSWNIARALLIHGARDPMRILCTRQYQASLSESVLALLEQQITALGLGGVYTVTKTSIIGRNGTEFIFRGLKDVNQIKSLENIRLVWVEEAQTVPENTWKVLTPTIRAAGSEIWVSFNPDLESDATYQRFVVHPPANAIVRQVGYLDNPWLPDVLAAEARDMAIADPEGFEHVWGGSPWSRSDAEVLSGKWIVQDFTPLESWGAPYFGGDFGFANDPAVAVKLWVADKRLWVEHEAGGVKLDMDQLRDAWVKIPGLADHTVRADSSRPETINELNRRKLKVIPAPKWDGSVKDGIEHLRSYETIVIHSRCVRARSEARLWRYKVDPRSGDVLPVLVDRHNHTWDATRYGLAPLIKQGRQPRFTVA